VSEGQRGVGYKSDGVAGVDVLMRLKRDMMVENYKARGIWNVETRNIILEKRDECVVVICFSCLCMYLSPGLTLFWWVARRLLVLRLNSRQLRSWRAITTKTLSHAALSASDNAES
jgi:hypothetical protein